MSRSNSDIDTGLKLYLEKKHRKNIVNFNKKVLNRLSTISLGQDAQNSYDFIFQSFSAANYLILDASRERFIKRMINRLKNSDMPDIVKDDAEIILKESNIVLDEHISRFNDVSSYSVANTIVKNSKIIADRATDDSDYNKLLSTYLSNKVNSLLINSVQDPAEQSKLVVAKNINKQSMVHSGKVINKTWVAVLDDKTRAWHAEADGQRVGLDSLFNVGGELLSRPGDTSHGASLSNIINCRCCQEFNL